MCLIVAKPKHKTLKKKTLRKAFKTNDHGAGFAVLQDDGLKMYKGYLDFNEFYRELIKRTKNYSYPALIHFRKQSCGALSLDNCHPFQVGTSFMAHNGTIKNFAAPKQEESDSFLFAQKLNEIPNVDSLLSDDHFISFLSFFTDGSKIAFITQDGEFKIVNKESGITNRGSWFSNNKSF